MPSRPFPDERAGTAATWLPRYYFLRGGVSIAWIILAATAGRHSLVVAGALLALYPAWDALANALDARRNGGWKASPSQSLNGLVSLVTAVVIAAVAGNGMKPVLIVFGVWAFLSGLLQLATGVRRWRSSGAQWAMVLSGGQSALVAALFFRKAAAVPVPGIEAVIPYAGLGAFYFLLSALWLTVRNRRERGAAVVAPFPF